MSSARGQDKECTGNLWNPDAQIDMLFVRADNVVNLFEMKYTSDVYTVTAKYAEELATKISAF